jgi:hypothetical protein
MRNFGLSNAFSYAKSQPDRHLSGYPLLAGEGWFERAKTRVRSRKFNCFQFKSSAFRKNRLSERFSRGWFDEERFFQFNRFQFRGSINQNVLRSELASLKRELWQL